MPQLLGIHLRSHVCRRVLHILPCRGGQGAIVCVHEVTRMVAACRPHGQEEGASVPKQLTTARVLSGLHDGSRV